MAGLEFRVLGSLEVARDDELIPVTAPKQRVLLSLLLLRANQPVSQDELIEVLWHGEAPQTARAALQNLVHALRRLLGAGTLTRTPAGYVLSAEPGAVDLGRFRRSIIEARGRPLSERAARLREALSLWRGSPFAELSSYAAAGADIVRLQEERLSALEDRVDADLELGEHLRLVSELKELVERDPLRERFWAQLMVALYRSGRQADSLASYRRAHATLVERLGIEPGSALKELQRAVLVHDPALEDPKWMSGSTLERAAAILPGEPPERARSLFEYGSALIRVGELRQAASTLRAAGRLAEAVGERGLQERVRIRLSYLKVFADGAAMAEQFAIAERAAGVFEDIEDFAGLAFALSYRAHLLRDTGHAEDALNLALRGADLARRAGDGDVEATCRRMAACCAAQGPTPIAGAIALCEAAETSRVDNDRHSVGDVVAWLLAQSGRIAEARALYERQLALLREQGIVVDLTVGLTRAALAERAAGNLGRAADLLREADVLGRAEELRGDVPCVAAELASVLALQGEQREARYLADESRNLAAPSDVLSAVLYRRALALVAAWEKRRDDAFQLAHEACSRARRTDWLTFIGETFEDAARAYMLVGEAGLAHEALSEALAVYERKGHLAGAERVRQAFAKSGSGIDSAVSHAAAT